MTTGSQGSAPHILAYGSKGGHWDQLMLLRPAFDGASRVTYATNDASLAAAYGIESCEEVIDYSRTHPMAVLRGLGETFALVRRLRPDVIVSTGAAPGLLILLWGRLMGAQTIWVDSIANAETPSLSGRLASRFAHRSLTQWQHLADGSQFTYWGSVL